MALRFAPVALSCVHGMTWAESIPLTDALTGDPIDLTGCELLMRVRQRITDTEHVLELSSTGAAPELTIADAQGGIITLLVPKETMQALPDPGARRKAVYVYDMTIIRGPSHEPGLGGKFTLRSQVTRAWQAT